MSCASMHASLQDTASMIGENVVQQQDLLGNCRESWCYHQLGATLEMSQVFFNHCCGVRSLVSMLCIQSNSLKKCRQS
ncbi:unnamed protein product [Choristocarpus tenellus]